MYVKINGNSYETSKLTFKDFLRLNTSGTIEDFEKLTGKKVRIKKVVEKNTHKKIVKDETIKKRAK